MKKFRVIESMTVLMVIGVFESEAQNVGIGTGTPLYKLDVNGNINTNVEYRLFGRPALRLGSLSGIYRNTYVGDSSGVATTGANNTFLGGFTGHNNISGSKNTFIGTNSGFSNTSGNQNTFAGANAGLLSTGPNNTFLGSDAGSTNTSGTENAFTGESSGKFNTTGNQNSFFGSSSGYSNNLGNSNSFIGHRSGYLNTNGSSNSFFGYKAGYSNTIGYSNIAIGTHALYNNTGINTDGELIHGLVAIGDSALFNNGLSTTLYFHATENTAIGSKSLFSNTYGYNNTAVGFNALFYNTAGYDNTAVGNGALYFNSGSGGRENTAVGRAALGENFDGEQNTAVGYYASHNNDDGIGNTALGYEALYSNNGNYNTAIGYGAGIFADFTPINYSTAIGVGANVTQSYSIILGSLENIPAGWPLTRVGIGVSAPAAALHIKANSTTSLVQLLLEENADDYARLRFQKTPLAGEFWDIAGNTNVTNGSARLNFFYNGVGDILQIKGDGNATLLGTLTQLSDGRLKTNIIPLENTLSQLMKINSYRYTWKNCLQENSVQIGLLAQEVQSLFPELVKTDDKGLLSVNYTGLIPVLITALKEQQTEIEELRKEIVEIKSLLKKQKY